MRMTAPNIAFINASGRLAVIVRTRAYQSRGSSKLANERVCSIENTRSHQFSAHISGVVTRL